MKSYDLIVVGSGAGLIVADAAIQVGKSCAIVERDRWGGTCLNHGCIPTKVLTTVANILEDQKKWARLGLEGQVPDIDWQAISKRVWAKIDENQDVYQYYINKGVDLYEGSASFIAEKQLVIKDREGQQLAEIEGQNIVLAVGSRCFIPDVPGLDEINYLTSRRFFGKQNPEKLYKSIIIVGGGAIGCEFAHLFNSFGVDVQIIQRNVRLLPKEDKDVSAKLQEVYAERGIRMHFKQNILKAYIRDGKKCLLVKERDNGTEMEVSADEILLATGIRSNTELLDVERAGIQVDESGNIRVNECLETGKSGVYALGDVIGIAGLRHKANNEAELLAHNLYLRKRGQGWRRQNYAFLPHVTFSSPEVAHVGLNEDQALAAGYKIEVGIRHYSENAKGYAMGYEAGDIDDGFAKMISDKKTGRILGLHVVGPQASVLMQAFPYLMNASPHEIPVLNEDLKASAACKKARTDAEENPEQLPLADSIDNLRQAITVHPSLAEVVAWLPEKLHAPEK